MCLYKITSEDFVCAHTAVVRTLWWWETAWGPPEWTQVGVQQNVLLLDTEPGLLVFALVVRFLAFNPVIAGWKQKWSNQKSREK